MKIKSYKKDKNCMYEITFENKEKLKLHEDLILKYELLLKKEIKDYDIENLLKENIKYELYSKTIKFLAIKMRCKKEIQKKFKEYDVDALDYVIDRLYKEGYLNDLEYVKAYINDQINLKCVGPYKIKNELVQLGFDDDLIDLYLYSFDDSVWVLKAKKLALKIAKTNHSKSNSMLGIKITNDLMSKGFSKEIIIKVLNDISFSDDNEILIKEMNKLYNKYKNKLSDSEIKFFLINKLLSKGYNRDQIEKNFDFVIK